jgi:hypothetical protein
MKLVRTIPRLGGIPELFVFFCSMCNQAETKEEVLNAPPPDCPLHGQNLELTVQL